jgi:hypothetical protein
MLPFGVGYQSDHRALFIKVNLGKILQTLVTQIDTITARKLNQETPKERKIFLEKLDNHYQSQNLYQRLRKLTENEESEWDKENVKTYKKCDNEMVAGMLLAESYTKKTKTTSWSPTFAEAINNKTFWKIAMSLKMNYRHPSQDFQNWAKTRGIPDIQSIELSTIKRNFRNAQKHLREIEKQADNLREEHLRSLLTTAELNGDDKKVEKRLQILIRAHDRKQHFARLKQILKPREAGGLSYILVPENFNIDTFPYEPEKVSTWEAIHDQEQIQNYVQK